MVRAVAVHLDLAIVMEGGALPSTATEWEARLAGALRSLSEDPNPSVYTGIPDLVLRALPTLQRIVENVGVVPVAQLKGHLPRLARLMATVRPWWMG